MDTVFENIRECLQCYVALKRTGIALNDRRPGELLRVNDVLIVRNTHLYIYIYRHKNVFHSEKPCTGLYIISLYVCTKYNC